MRNVLLAVFGLIVLPSMAFAQFDDCPECTMGIFSDTDLMQNFETFTGNTMDIYLGVKYGNSAFDGLSGVEFSISGLEPFIVQFEGLDNPTVTLGSPQAPEDTTSGSGGMNIAWGSCLSGDRAVLRMTLIALGPVGDDIVLNVLRKFPSSNPNARIPLFTQCDNPVFTKTKVTPGCFVVNPTVGPGESVDGCLLFGTAIEDQAWSAVKSLYRE